VGKIWAFLFTSLASYLYPPPSLVWGRVPSFSSLFLIFFLKPREKIKKAENLEFVLSKEGWKGIYYQS
jgi:hypothetical protein